MSFDALVASFSIHFQSHNWWCGTTFTVWEENSSSKEPLTCLGRKQNEGKSGWEKDKRSGWCNRSPGTKPSPGSPSSFSLFTSRGEKFVDFEEKREGGEPPFFSLSFSPCALSSVSSSILRKFFPLGKKRQQAFLEIIFFSCCLTLGFCQVRHTSACFLLFWRRRANNTYKKRFSQVQKVAHKGGTQGGGSK